MKSIMIVLGIGALFILGLFSLSFLGGDKANSAVTGGQLNNVSIVDGRQIIEIRAKGGYQPRRTVAKAGIPTTLKVDTGGTFDCSAALRIPSKGISKLLPNSGVTEFDLGTNAPGVMRGTCSMGMYSFEIDFRS